MVKIYSLSGVSSIGAVMIGYEIGDEIILCDLGANSLKAMEFKYDLKSKTKEELTKTKVIVDISKIPKDRVKAIVLSNADYNHCGAVEILAKEFKCTILCTSYVYEVIKKTQNIQDFEKRIKVIRQNSAFTLFNTEGLSVEMINITYSVPQSSLVAIHTQHEGVIVHAPAFKLDNRPTLGYRPNYRKLEELKRKGVSLVVCDALRSNVEEKTLSEVLVKEMIRDTFIETDIVGTCGIIVAADPSCVGRIKSIIDLSIELNRKVIIAESLEPYISSAKKINLLKYDESSVILCTNKEETGKHLKTAQDNKKEFVVICDGDQGEPWGTLSQIVSGNLPYKLDENDKIIFSSRVIPEDPCKSWREELDREIEKIRCKSFKDMHISGHGSASDIKDLLILLKPKKVIPIQGNIVLKEGFIEIAEELGFVEGKTLLLVNDNEIVEL